MNKKLKVMLKVPGKCGFLIFGYKKIPKKEFEGAL